MAKTVFTALGSRVRASSFAPERDTVSHRVHEASCHHPWTLVQGLEKGTLHVRRVAGHRWWSWMAAFAVWIAVLAPTVSRTAEACVFPELSAMCGAMAAGHEHHHHGGGHHDDGDAACGYCTLFASIPALGGSFFVHGVAFVTAPPPAVRPVARGVARETRLHPPSRGPPVVV